MKRKFLSGGVSRISLIMAVALCLSALLCLAACTPKDANSWKLDGGVSAALSDDGNHGFILSVSGSGAMKDFSSKKDAPWYGKSGRIKQIQIADGITYVAANAFTDCAVVSSVFVPESVTKIGSAAFSDNTVVLCYGTVESGGATVYSYSEQNPKKDGYWHMVDGVPTVWQKHKVLFIGNSFTFYPQSESNPAIPNYFKNIADSMGEWVEVDYVVRGSHTLAKFANKTDTCGKIVDDKLNSASDYTEVVLQEHSTTPINSYNSYVNAAKQLRDKVMSTQKSCRVFVYSTWGYSGVGNYTIPQMEGLLRAACAKAAAEIGATVVPVGAAFTEVYQNHTEIGLYYEDNKHQAATGAFLSACVHAATLLDVDVTTCTYNGSGISAADAATLKQVAMQIVSQK